MRRYSGTELIVIAASWLILALYASFGHAQTTVADTDRKLTLKNSCSFPVWWGYTGGSYDCSSTSGKCNFQIGKKATVTPTEIAAKGSTSVKLDNSTVKSGTSTIKWSGNVWAAKGCKKPVGGKRLVCESVNCGPGGCTSAQAPTGTRTLAEFTLQTNAQDYYDISAIPGFNIPIAMGPTGGQTYGPAPADKAGTPAVEPSAYWCTTAGSAVAQGKLSACSWDAALGTTGSNTPASASASKIILVTPKNLWDSSFTTTSCTTDNDCTGSPGGSQCGMWQEVADTSYGPTNNVKQICGEYTGIITPNGYCAYAGTGSKSWKDAAAPWLCGADSGQTSGGTNGTYSSLYECNSINAVSGYQTTSKGNDLACGCENWKFGDTDLPVGQLGCQANSSVWQDKAKWGAQAVKYGCPTAYSYPFDDETSTFNCQTAPGQTNAPNVTNYTIEFCPGGKEGGLLEEG